MNRRQGVRYGVLAGVAIVLLGWGGREWLYARTHETTDDAQVEGHVVPIIPKVGGYVARVYVDDNQRVQIGDTLFTLDPSDYRVRLAQAEAEADAARAAASGGSATAAVEAARAQARAAEANVQAAAATYTRAQRDVVRFRDLTAKDVSSRSQLEAAEAAFQVAAAGLQAARDQARAAASSLAAATANERNAEARLAAARAAVDNARLQLAYTVVTAPTSGRIARKTAEVGQLVAPGQPLMAVVDGAGVWVVANLKETQLGRVAVGQTAEFTVDAYGDRTFRGRVESIQEATGARFALLPPDNATGNFTKIVQRVPVKIVVEGAAARGAGLRPGMSVEVAIDTRSVPSPQRP